MPSRPTTLFIKKAGAASLLLLCCALLGCTSSAPDQSAFSITREKGGYLIREGRDSVLFYQRHPRFPDSAHARGHYVHPLYGLNGQVLTENMPADHPHHHGIFWAWHQIYVGGKRVGDAWTQDDFAWEVYRVDMLEETDTSAALRAHVRWTSPRWTDAGGQQQPFVRETTTLRAHRTAGDHRAVDVEIKLRALTDSVRIGGSENRKGYGGFSARIRLPDDIQFIGPDGPVEPSTYQVKAGPWLDFSGSFRGERPSGLALLSHPSLPNYPPPWILRRRGSMQNAVFPGRDLVHVPRDTSLTLRYRMIVHRGRARNVNLDSLHALYSTRSLDKAG